jgi:hypothetical protein
MDDKKKNRHTSRVLHMVGIPYIGVFNEELQELN